MFKYFQQSQLLIVIKTKITKNILNENTNIFVILCHSYTFKYEFHLLHVKGIELWKSC